MLTQAPYCQAKRLAARCRHTGLAVTSKQVPCIVPRCLTVGGLSLKDNYRQSLAIRRCTDTKQLAEVSENQIPAVLHADVTFEVKDDVAQPSIEYDEESKVLKVPLSSLSGGARRTRQVTFTCNKCGGRTTRMVNPISWEKGVVFGQCSHCEVWHVLSANNPKIFQEIRYKDEATASTQLDEEDSTQNILMKSIDSSD